MIGKSKKQTSFESQLKKVYAEIDNSRERVCTGCGVGKCLSHSHLISRAYKDTMCDPRNITYHCLPMEGCNGCSAKWEMVGERCYLNDYIQNMEYIKEVNYDRFTRMITSDHEFLLKNVNNGTDCESYSYICDEYLKL